MATRFLAGELIIEALRRANAQHATRRLGVAYWGAGAVERLGLGSALGSTRVICDLWSEGCHAGAILDLIRGGATIMTVEGFHAKTYLYPGLVVLGSANASRGGLGASDEPPARTETAVLCDDETVIDDASVWFEAAWRRGTPVDATMVEAARGELTKVREARRPTLLHALAHEPKPFDGLDVWVTLYKDGAPSDEAERTWKDVEGEYGLDDRQGYDARGEAPFYEVRNDILDDCRPGRIYLDFSRPGKGKPAFNGIWKVRTQGHRPIVGTDRSLALLDRLPSLRGLRVGDTQMQVFRSALGKLPDGDWPVASPQVREIAWTALKAAAA
ncbi:phospholipase D family protein [Methylobacterium sp. C33D]